MAYFSLVISTGLGCIFLASGLLKLQKGSFSSAVARYRLLPGALVAPVALALPVAECVIGLLLLIGVAHPEVKYAAAFLCAIFSIAILINLLRGNRIECGCRASTREISWSLFGIDIALMLLSIIAARTPSLGILLTALGHGILHPSTALAVSWTLAPLWLTVRILDAAREARRRARAIELLSPGPS